MTGMLNSALKYADAGIPVLPIIRGGDSDKLPYISEKEATTDPDIIEQWFIKWPAANIGIATGRGLVVIDLDRGHGAGDVDGVANFNAWELENGSFPETWTATTGKGGRHLYIKTDLDIHNVQQKQPENLKGVDLRGAGGYAIAPPSIAANGQPYTWDVAPDEMPAARDDGLLQKLYTALKPQKESKSQETPEIIREGERNGTLLSLAGKLRKYNGLTEKELYATLQAVNKSRCCPPLNDKEVESIAKSAAGYDGGTLEKKETPAPPFVAYSVKDYLEKGQFEKDITYFQKYKDRKTGFQNLDAYLTLYPGMATLGGAASLGKSTFCTMLGDNLAKAGETVLYFAMEQDVIELTTKSLARTLAERSLDKNGIPKPPTDNTGIKNGAQGDRLTAARKEYCDTTAGNMTVIRCNFTTTAAEIRDYIEDYIAANNVRPVVVIDYLQLISPPEDFKGDTREAIDLAIKTLKTMQLKNELFVLVVSSFNRGGYNTPVSYEDFKESSLIEYTSDYIWGLELTVLTEDKFYYTLGPQGGFRQTNEKQKNDMTKQALQEYPKRVTFTSLKNRNGQQSFSGDFLYYTNYDYFVPIERKKWEQLKVDTTETDDFEEISLEDMYDIFGEVPPV